MENKNKKRTSKLLLVLNILMLMTLITVPTYAFFWNSRTVDKNVDVVTGTVTEGLVVVTPGALDSTKELIPSSATHFDPNTEVKTLVYTITVGLDINEKLKEEDLKVSFADLGFLTPTVSKSEVDNNVLVTITFTIELDAKDWTYAHDGVPHNVKVELLFDPEA